MELAVPRTPERGRDPPMPLFVQSLYVHITVVCIDQFHFSLSGCNGAKRAH